jgi:DNA mismatch repair protein MutH
MEKEETAKAEAKFNDRFSPYFHRSVDNLCNTLGIKSGSKSLNNLIIRGILKTCKNDKDISTFLDSPKFLLKTVQLTFLDTIKESLSLAPFKYCELASEKWDNSTLKAFFEETTFVFFVFKENAGVIYFERIVLWKAPKELIESSIKETWEQVHDCVVNGTIVKYIDEKGRLITNFPGASDGIAIHVRPHALNSQDCYPLPVADKVTGKLAFTKYSFWLNRGLVYKIVVLGGTK